MKKKLFMFAIALFWFAPFVNVNAEEFNVSSELLLRAYLSTGADIKLTSDITMSDNIDVNAISSIDLNGHTINTASKSIYVYEKLVIKDTSSDRNGKITGTGTYILRVGTASVDGNLVLESGNIDCLGKNYCVTIGTKGKFTVNGGEVLSKVYPIVNSGDLDINGGTILSTNGGVIYGNTNSVTTLNNGLIKTTADYQAVLLSRAGAKFIMNDGKVEALCETGHLGVGIQGFKNTEVIINGGEVISTGQAIMGNGSGPESGNNDGSNAKFTINGGKIVSTKAIAIYAPQINGDTTITGGLIQGESTGIEIRAGKLTITGGTIIGNKDRYELIPNANGSNVIGAAVSVVQHTTKQPIDVNITGGKLISFVPFVETNSMNNSAEDLSKIKISITNGEFESFGSDTVQVEDVKDKFITGGTYSNSVQEYIVDGYGEKNDDDSITVLKYMNIEFISNQDNNTLRLPGEKVTLTPAEKEGYKLDKMIVKDAEGNLINVNNNEFVMPDSNVTIEYRYNFIYEIISGNSQTFKLDDANDVTIKANGDLSKLTGIKVDGTLIDADNYTTTSESTILILNNSYLKTLSVGNHTISFVYNDGTVDATLTIVEASSTTTNNNTTNTNPITTSNPQTGDNIMFYISMLGLSIIGLAGAGLYIRKRRFN